MALTYVPAGRVPANDLTTRQDDDAVYWKRLQQLAVFQEPSAVTSVAFSPVKPYSLATTSSVRLSLYDTTVCEPMNMFSRFKQAVFGAKFRKDGQLVAIGGEEGKVRVFDIERTSGTGKAPLRVVKASTQHVRVVDFASSGRSLFSMADDGKIKQWDLGDTGSNPLAEVAAHSDAIRCGVVSSFSDNIVVSGGYDHKVKLWDMRNVASGQPSVEFDVGAPVESVLFLPSENLLATASANIVKVWDISAGGRQLASITQHHKTVTTLCLGGNGTCLLSGAIDRRINVFNLSNFSLIHSMSMASPVLGLASSPDDSMLAVAMGSLLALHRRAPVKEVITATGYADKTSVVRRAAAPVEVVERGGEKTKREILAKQAATVKLDNVDKHLKAYRHAAAVKTMFNAYYVREKKEQIVGWLKQLVHRRVIHAALAGQETDTLMRLIRFLYEQMFKNNYFEVLRHVAEALFEVYAEEEVDPRVCRQMVRLRDSVTRELTVQKQLSQCIGILEMVLSNGRSQAADDGNNDTTDIFGDVTVSTLPLPAES